MYYRKPIVASDCKSVKNIIQKTGSGLIFKANDPKDLANRILELYHNRDLGKSLGKKGREAVLKEYNWEKITSVLIACYSKLVNNYDKLF